MVSRDILVPGQSSSSHYEEVVAFYFYSVEKLYERNKYSGLGLGLSQIVVRRIYQL